MNNLIKNLNDYPYFDNLSEKQWKNQMMYTREIIINNVSILAVEFLSIKGEELDLFNPYNLCHAEIPVDEIKTLKAQVGDNDIDTVFDSIDLEKVLKYKFNRSKHIETFEEGKYINENPFSYKFRINGIECYPATGFVFSEDFLFIRGGGCTIAKVNFADIVKVELDDELIFEKGLSL
jgi:hypothetical protein